MLEMLTDPNIWAAFITLSILEIVLGIDNIIFLSIISSRLPKEKQRFARMLGLSLALIMRIVLLACIAWLANANDTLFTVLGEEISIRDLILGGGGIFLLYKATVEIHHEMEGTILSGPKKAVATMGSVIVQIVLIDLVFSLDSIFTAVGVADDLPVMVAAIVVAILIMLFAAETVSKFVNEHPTIKMLALAFLVLIGVVLCADALDFHIPRGYIYMAIAFSLGVEALNQTAAKARARHNAKKDH